MSLVCRLTDGDGQTILNLNGDGMKVMRGMPSVAPPSEEGGPARVEIGLFNKADNAAMRMRKDSIIRRFLAEAKEAASKAHYVQWRWLEMWETDEYPRRILVRDGLLQYAGDQFGTVLQNETGAMVATLVLETEPYWESVSSRKISDSLAAQGDRMILPPMGDAPGRIDSFLINNIATTTATIQTIDIGVREKLRGVSDFDPLVPISATSVALTASEGTIKNDSLANYFPSATYYEHFQGRYKLILFGSTTCTLAYIKAQLTMTGFVLYPTIVGEAYVENGNFRIDIGTWDIPHAGFDRELPSGSIERIRLELSGKYIDNTAGSAITIDHGLLVPDGNGLHITNAYYNGTAQGDNQQRIFTAPNGNVTSYSYDKVSDYANRPSNAEMDRFYYPPEGGTLVLRGSTSSYGSFSAASNVDLYVTPRWHLHRNRQI